MRQAVTIKILILTTTTFICQALSKVVHNSTEMLSNLCNTTQLVGGGARVCPRYGAV